MLGGLGVSSPSWIGGWTGASRTGPEKARRRNMESAAAPVSRTQTRGTETLERGNQETAVLQRRRDIPFPRPGHPDTERMGNRPGAVVSAWRRPLLGRYQHPCTTHVRAPVAQATHGEPDAGKLARPVRRGG